MDKAKNSEQSLNLLGNSRLDLGAKNNEQIPQGKKDA